jgi:formylglycine-generating enzyme required for sulfatase activity
MAVASLLRTIEDPAVALRVRIAAGKALGYLGDPRLGALVEIGAGEFLMGDDDASPRHRLFLPDYKIRKYPVTNSEFSRFMDAGGYAQKRWWSEAGWAFWRNKEREKPHYWDDDRVNAPNQPVVGISWFEALAYCRWLAWETGTPYELPGEAQWEKAARGQDGRIYPWGNDFAPEAANCNEGKQMVRSTTPVGIYPTGISPFGCLDMAGNVWEWTRSLWGKDWEQPEFKYPYNPDDGRENTDAEIGVLRVLRGGSWVFIRDYARCSYRYWYSPSLGWDDYSGFRVAVSPIISGL